MLREGADAPTVTLPAWVDGERREVDLAEHVGEGIVVLGFYPADFNPGCTMQSSDLGDLDLFTMQKDVSVFAVSPDSTYSHEAFAERYSLNVPLLSDREGEAAEAYDVTAETDVGERIVQRAVFVVDHRGEIRYAWATDDLEELPDVDPVKRAVGDIGGDETALERYRVGHEAFVEGRESFTEAMSAYDDSEWMVARNGFEAAESAFATAADHLDTAVRFAETDDFETVVDRAQQKADTLDHAAKWLAESADAFASGSGAEGKQYREDAEPLLETATDLADPAPPETFDLEPEGVVLDDAIVVDPDDGEEERYAWRRDDDGADSSLGIDDAELDAAVAGDESAGGSAEGAADGDATPGEAGPGADIEGDIVEGDLEMDLDAVEGSDAEADDADEGDAGSTDVETADAGAEPTDSDANPADVGATDGVSAPPGGGGESPPAGDRGAGTADADGDGDDGRGADVEDVDAEAADAPDAAPGEGDGEMLDLADPTEGEDDEDDEDDERADWDIPGR